MASEDDLVHHDGVDPLRDALVLHQREELLDHEHDDVELGLRVAAEVNAHGAVDEVVGDLLVGVPLGHLVQQLVPKTAADVLAHLNVCDIYHIL